MANSEAEKLDQAAQTQQRLGPRVEAAAQAMAEAWGYEWTTDVGCHQALGTGQGERPTKHDFREGAKAALAADVHHRERLTQPGDTMQSAASRVLAWLDTQTVPEGGTPYEVSMAMIELRDAINEWTEARRA